MSSFENNPGMHLQNLILDTNVTATNVQKIECLKLLKVVVKNLSDATKCCDPKYRQLRLSNEKVEKKLLPCPSAISYLEAIGFQKVTDQDGSRLLRIVESVTVDVNKMEASLLELTNALEMLGHNSSEMKKSSSFVEEKKTPEGYTTLGKSLSSTSISSTNSGPMSEKQKARLLMEKKRQREAAEAKAARAKTSAMIKQDKYVRKHDENWKSGQSAACVKSGDSISTFRDKYGEH